MTDRYEGGILCAANSANMLFYFNEEKYGILPEEVKKELKILCVLYCSDVGGIISMGFSEDHRLMISTIEPIDEIGAELKIEKMRRDNEELFSMLEGFSRKFFGEETFEEDEI